MDFASLLGLSAEEWSALAAWTTAAVALAAGFVAYRQLGELRQTRRDQTQPYVVVYMEGSEAGSEFIELIIKNTGLTAAFDVRVTFSPALERQAGGQTADRPEPVLLPEAFPVLVPNQEWRTFWDTTIARHDSALPARYRAVVAFEERSGRRVEAHELNYVLDWRVEASRGPIRVFGVHHQASATRDLAKEVKRWRSGQAGLLVWTRDGEKRQRRLNEHVRSSSRPQRRLDRFIPRRRAGR